MQPSGLARLGWADRQATGAYTHRLGGGWAACPCPGSEISSGSEAGRGQAAPLQIGLVVDLEIVDASRRDHQPGIVAPLNVLLLRQIPDRELEVLAGPA